MSKRTRDIIDVVSSACLGWFAGMLLPGFGWRDVVAISLLVIGVHLPRWANEILR